MRSAETLASRSIPFPLSMRTSDTHDSFARAKGLEWERSWRALHNLLRYPIERTVSYTHGRGLFRQSRVVSGISPLEKHGTGDRVRHARGVAFRG